MSLWMTSARILLVGGEAQDIDIFTVDGVVAMAMDVLGPVAATWTTPRGYLDTAGNDVGMDGFFAAHLQRQSC